MTRKHEEQQWDVTLVAERLAAFLPSFGCETSSSGRFRTLGRPHVPTVRVDDDWWWWSMVSTAEEKEEKKRKKKNGEEREREDR